MLHPSLRAEGERLDEILLIQGRNPREDYDGGSRRDAKIAERRIDIGVKQSDRSDRPQAHRLIGDRAGARQPVGDVDVFRDINRPHHFVRLAPDFRHPFGTVAKVVDRPRQRVCGRIFASEQHGHEIRHDHIVGKGLALFVHGGQHRLEEIGRHVGAVGIRLQAGARVVHEAAEPGANIPQCALEPPVGGRPNNPPDRKQRKETAVDRRKNDLQLALDHIIGLFDRVDVVAEGDQHRHVDSEPLELLDEIKRLPSLGGPLPAPLQPGGHGPDAGVELAKMALGKRGDGKLALRTPGVPFRVEHALNANL